MAPLTTGFGFSPPIGGKGLAHQDVSHLPQYGRALGSAYFDWTVGHPFSVPLIIGNQEQTLACTSFATQYIDQILSYLHTGTLHNGSQRFLYANTHLPTGGAYAIAPMTWMKNKGIADLSAFPDDPMTEEHMESVEGETPAVLTNAELNNFYQSASIVQVPITLNDAANAIVNEYAVGLCVSDGSNEGWATADVRPPIPTDTRWGEGHMVCGFQPVMRSGQPKIHFANSWGMWGENGCGYIGQDYFDAGLVSAVLAYSASSIINNDPMDTIIQTPEDLDVVCFAVNHRHCYVGGQWVDEGQKGYIGQTVRFVLSQYDASSEWKADDALIQAGRNYPH